MMSSGDICVSYKGSKTGSIDGTISMEVSVRSRLIIYLYWYGRLVGYQPLVVLCVSEYVCPKTCCNIARCMMNG